MNLPDVKKIIAKFKTNPKAVSYKRVACQADVEELLILEAEKKGRTLEILGLNRLPLAGDSAKKASAIKLFWAAQKFEDRPIRLAVSGGGVIVRFIQFPKMSLAELQSAVTYEAEKYIPFKASEVILDYAVVTDKKDQSLKDHFQVMLVAAKKDEIWPLIQFYDQAGVHIEVIDVNAVAYVNAIEFFYPEILESFFAVLDVRKDLTTFFVVQHGHICFMRDIPYGSQDIVKRLQRKLSMEETEAVKWVQSDFRQNPQVTAEVEAVLSQLVGEIKLTINYFEEQTQAFDAIKKILIHPCQVYEHLLAGLTHSQLGVNVETINFIDHLSLKPGMGDSQKEAIKNVSPSLLGLCVRD